MCCPVSLEVKYFIHNDIDKMNLDELQFLNMVATSDNLLQPGAIGRFLHHAILDATISKFDKNLKVMIKNLRALFMINDKDLFLMTQILAMNDFSNLKLFEPYDLINEHVDFDIVQICFKDMNITQEEVQEFEEQKSESTYFKPSPCLSNDNIGNQCQEYCQWQDAIEKEFTEISALQRYFKYQLISNTFSKK